jgi:hypothetical protein
METPEGKLFLKYRKWGSEQMSLFAKRVVAPMVRAWTFGKYQNQTVDIINEDGEKENLNVPGAFFPGISPTWDSL